MALAEDQRAYLERAGVDVVRIKLHGHTVGWNNDKVAFSREMVLTRVDIEEWLAEKTMAQEKQNRLTLLWARIAGCSGIIGALVGLAGAVLAAIALMR